MTSFHAIYVVPSRDAAFPTLGVRLFGPRPIQSDGAALRAVAWLFTDNVAANAPYVVHETGHVLGLPDLAFPGAGSTFNHWDAMATGGTIGVAGGMYAWHRWKLGWLEDAQIACLARVGRRTARVRPLERAGDVKAVVVRSGQTAYVAEVRQPLAEDRGICQKGVLVYSVDLRPPLRGGPSRGAIRIQSDRFGGPADGTPSVVGACVAPRVPGAAVDSDRSRVERVVALPTDEDDDRELPRIDERQRDGLERGPRKFPGPLSSRRTGH